ncbi:MAG TPA: HEAT repeat domain-containing protein [Bryobacteraceae bacterium]
MKRYLVAMLWTNSLLIPCLIDPATPPPMAESIAAFARRVDPQLPAKLVGFVLERTEAEPPECLERVLGLLKSMPDAANFRPLLTPLLRHPNARLRAKVALLVGEGNRNRTWFERRMLEEDPRVRANVIESAGPAVAEDLRPMFWAAASDANNRVVGNALVALYRLGEAESVGRLYDLVSHPDPAFRATAVWAIGETGDTRFLPVLARILSDPNETIKAATFRAMQKLRGRESVSAQPLAIRILNEPQMPENGTVLKVVFAVSNKSKPVLALPATAVRVLVNGEFAYRYSVAEQDSGRRISAAFLLPRTSYQKPAQTQRYLGAVEKCFERRHKGDIWTLSQYVESEPAGPSRTETLFGVRMEASEANGTRLIGNLAELRAAIDSHESVRCLSFADGFLRVCRDLRQSKVSSHLFIIDPEAGLATDPAALARVAQEARVMVHASCSLPDPAVREICRLTGGFYAISSDIAETLPAFYQGICYRYVLSLPCDGEVRKVQVAVRSAETCGDSPTVEMSP